MTDIELKSRPKCRGSHLNFMQASTGGGWWVICHDCHLTVDTRAETKGGAALDWNTRPSDASALAPSTSAQVEGEPVGEVCQDCGGSGCPACGGFGRLYT